MKVSSKSLYDGFLTGLLLQFAIGPVFLFIINTSLQKTIYDGLLGVAAVTIVDYLYITLSIFGVGTLLQNMKIKKMLGIVSAVVLFIFGLFMFAAIFDNSRFASGIDIKTSSVLSSFLTTFVLTVSNPLTIVFWTSIFTAKSIERNYTMANLFCFGISAGFATPLFLGSSVLLTTFFKSSIPHGIVIVLNSIVGIFLMVYAVVKWIQHVRKSTYGNR